MKKLGRCRNVNCSLPGLEGRAQQDQDALVSSAPDVARKTRYFSVECQKLHWKRLREDCDERVEARAAFNSEQYEMLLSRQKRVISICSCETLYRFDSLQSIESNPNRM